MSKTGIETEKTIIKNAMRFGDKIPDRIANAPWLKPGLALYLWAFFELDTERSHALGLTRIPWSAIKNYADFYNFDSEQTEDLIYHIRKMDEMNLKRLESRNGKK